MKQAIPLKHIERQIISIISNFLQKTACGYEQSDTGSKACDIWRADKRKRIKRQDITTCLNKDLTLRSAKCMR
jgi:histone H3/H4